MATAVRTLPLPLVSYLIQTLFSQSAVRQLILIPGKTIKHWILKENDMSGFEQLVLTPTPKHLNQAVRSRWEREK